MEKNQKLLNQAKHEARLVEWRERVKECRNCGLQITQWCKENGINTKTYYHCQREVWNSLPEEIKAIEPAKQTAMRFVEVPNICLEAQQKDVSIVIQKSGWRIELPEHANPEIVSRVIQTVARYV